MEEKLTRERALKLHRQMWSDMQEKLGNNPSFLARLNFKEEWCKENGFVNIDTNCFLCEYSIQHKVDHLSCNCLIDWKPLTGKNYCMNAKNDVYDYRDAPISEILELPERKIKEVYGSNNESEEENVD